MPERVRITDVSPRDGLQNEPGVIPAHEKIELIERLAATGVDEVEITSFVSPKWVPQLGDASEVCAGVRAFVEGVRGVAAWTPDRARQTGLPVFSVLIPNEKGLERALEVHGSGLALKAAFFAAASETFSRKNTNATIDESVERIGAALPRALETGMAVRVYVSCAVACPFEGPISPGTVRRVAEQLLGLFPDDASRAAADLDLGDTIGVAHPADIVGLLSEFDESERGRLTLHLHDTFGRAAACVRAGLEMGVRSFDGSAGGLGGCPYAGTADRRAPGNISTETLVRAVREAGFACGVDEEAMREAGAYARRITGAARAGGAL